LSVRIAILGTRGIPANYGGFETFAEELSTRLAKRGYDVTVYCRQRYSQPRYRGVRLVYLPTIRHKYFDTIAHSAISTLHLLFHRQDVVLYCNAANAIFTILPRITGMPVALNVDGLERKRRKWNKLARAWYLMSERLSTILPTAVVSDAEEIQKYYRTRYNKDSTFISYGAELGKVPASDTLRRLGLEPGRYFLYVSRMEPENNALLVRQAFEDVDTDMKLALIGDAPYAHDYIRAVKDTRDPRIVIPGAIYGQGYQELTSNCFAYIHATEVGGTHPALIESMGRGAVVLYLDTPENTEVASGAGLPFCRDLTDRMRQVLAMPDEERAAWSQRAEQCVAERYSWDAVTDAYEQLLLSLAANRKGG
jgi:glycosyltransferase involved in cell wall biosynthesis